MSGSFILDTNIVIAYLEGDSSVEEHYVSAEAI